MTIYGKWEASRLVEISDPVINIGDNNTIMLQVMFISTNRLHNTILKKDNVKLLTV